MDWAGASWMVWAGAWDMIGAWKPLPDSSWRVSCWKPPLSDEADATATRPRMRIALNMMRMFVLGASD